MIVVAPTESQILAALRAFLLAAAPSGWDVVLGQDNRVPEPSAQNYVVMWPILRPRLGTNVDVAVDRAFAASIAGTTMTVTAIAGGLLGPAQGAALFGTGVAAGSAVGAPIATNPDGTGTWAVSPSQTVASRTMACGQSAATQPTEVIIQCDVHAAKLQDAGDAAASIATLFRDAFAVDIIRALQPAVTPLFADDPRQTPFVDGEQQYESRWSVDLHLQADQTVSGIPQQFFDQLDVQAVSVEAAHPPE